MASTLIRSPKQAFVTVGTGYANYIVNGSNDRTIIQAAIDYVSSQGGGTVFCKVPSSPYTCDATSIKLPSNVVIEGEDMRDCIFRKQSGVNGAIFTNLSSADGNSFIQVKNLTLDQQGATQTANGCVSMTNVTDSLFERVYFEKSYKFNLFFGSTTGTLLTGTLTYTNGSDTVTGSSTLFTTELSIGDILRSGSNHFQRVEKINSDTSLQLDRAWGWSSETGVTSRRVPPNARNKLINCVFDGTIDESDNVGLGLFDHSLIQGCTSRNADSGYGFGPDHANFVRFIGNTIYDNDSSGIGMETCGHCVVQANDIYRNANGVLMWSGSYRNIVNGNQVHHNDSNGISSSYNTTSFPLPGGNTIIGNHSYFNGGDGIYLNGQSRSSIIGNHSFNNGNTGIRIQTGNSIVPDKTNIANNQCYDDQSTKTQVRGIHIQNGTNTLLTHNISFDADHVTAGITDSGTGTISDNNVTA